MTLNRQDFDRLEARYDAQRAAREEARIDRDYDDEAAWEAEQSGEDDELDPEASCSTCGGEGWVDSVAQESGRHGWDSEGPGDCPNCGGSGLRKDQHVF